jgi:hypothetical protein
MEIAVLVEKIAGNGFRAKGGEPFGLEAEGTTRDEAVQKLRALIDHKLRSGAEVLKLEIPTKDNPWHRMAGTLDPNDPLVQEWIQIMEENRRKADEDPDFLWAFTFWTRTS